MSVSLEEEYIIHPDTQAFADILGKVERETGVPAEMLAMGARAIGQDTDYPYGEVIDPADIAMVLPPAMLAIESLHCYLRAGGKRHES